LSFPSASPAIRIRARNATTNLTMKLSERRIRSAGSSARTIEATVSSSDTSNSNGAKNEI